MVDTAINTGLATFTVRPKDRSIASMSGASQLLMPANMHRKGFVIENDGANVLYLTWTTATAAADAVGTFELGIGASINYDSHTDNVPKGAIYVLGTAGQPVYADENLGYFAAAS